MSGAVGASGAPTVRTVLASAVEALTEAGVETPRLDAELLLADALGAGRELLAMEPELALTGETEARFGEHLRRRVDREPVAYILGRRGFRRLDVGVDRRVLIPRPQTELLVEVALGVAEGGRVHEVGTGSGAVVLALKDERPDLIVTGSDADPATLEVARANRERLGLEVELVSAMGLPERTETGGPTREYDLILANLPYVRDDEWHELEPEINRHEPASSMVAGPEGMDIIRAFVAELPAGLAVALEHAPAQSEAVAALLAEPQHHTDLTSIGAVTTGRVR